MNDLTDRIAQSIKRHFVTLSCMEKPPYQDNRYPLVYSGFVVDIAGEWFYITAGHILRYISDHLGSGSIFDVWRFGDHFAGNKFENKAIPYDFQFDHWYVLENAERGLDYAIGHIGDLYRSQLEAGGIVAFGESAWGDYTANHEGWMLAGIPSESVSYDGKATISARFVLAPLTQTAPPVEAKDMAGNQFYAKLHDAPEDMLKNLDGMSGGPIVMIQNLDGAWKYGIIGIQSGWYRSSRVITACPFSSFAKELKPYVEEALATARKSSLSAT